jgi:hypothetical protein
VLDGFVELSAPAAMAVMSGFPWHRPREVTEAELLPTPAPLAPSVVQGQVRAPGAFVPSGAPAWSPLRQRDGLTAQAFVRDDDRATLLIVTGFNMGRPRLDALIVGVKALQRRKLGVVLLGLPLHGQTPLLGGAPPWPGVDLELTRDAVAVSTYETRQLIAWLKQRNRPVAALGLSLGAWPVMLSATLPSPPDFAVAVTPMVDYPALLAEHAPPTLLETRVAEIRQTFEGVLPQSRAPTLESTRTLVLGAARDRVTKFDVHAAPLARHFGARLVKLPGTHLAPVGRSEMFDEVDALVTHLGAR